MRTLVSVIGLLMAFSIPGRAQAYLAGPVPEDDHGQEIARLAKELYQAKLGQIALVTDRYSESKSRLLIALGASAEPRVGLFMRPAVSGQMPFVTVYPVSAPVSAKLEGIGPCELLGAVALRVEATATEGDDKDRGVVAKPDVYLVAYGMNDGWLGEARLLSVAVDDEGRVKFEQVLCTLADRAMNVSSLAPPAVVVKFPGADEVSNDNPAWRASVTMVCPKYMYEFALDLRIIMK